MKSVLLTVMLTILISGCGTNPPKISNTKTGYPEIAINKPIRALKPLLINDAVDRGYTLKKDSDYTLEFTREPRTSGENVKIGLLVGNSHSTNTVELQYTLVEIGGKTRVIGKTWLQAVMPFGKTNKMPLKGSHEFNSIQGFFNDLKQKVE